MNRIIQNIIAIITVCLVGLSTLTSCSKCGSGRRATSAELIEAQTMGRQRAINLVGVTDTLALEQELLDIRAREHALRTKGYDDVADSFIDSFTATLDSVCPALAAELHD